MSHLSELTALYRDVLTSPGDTRRLDRFRQHWSQALPQLTDDQINDILAAGPLDHSSSPEWLSQVYQALSEAEPLPCLPVDSRNAMIEANEHEEGEIGHAFKDGLLNDLEDLKDLSAYFMEVPPVSWKRQKDLREVPSVIAARPQSLMLVEHGLTPLGVFYATTAVVSLANRLRESGTLESLGPVCLSYPRGSSLYTCTPSGFVDYCVAEVMGVSHCGEQAAAALIRWLIDVARVKPYIFKGASAVQHPSGVLLDCDKSTPGSLLERWMFRPLVQNPIDVVGTDSWRHLSVKN
jgi:hypothetical protein